MCLEFVAIKYAEPSPEVIECYKVFDRDGEKLIPFVYKRTWIDGSKFPSGEWIEDTNKGSLHGEMDYVKYTIGFHAFLTERAAESFMTCLAGLKSRSVVKKVKLTEIVAIGRQYDGHVIVGRKMWIEP